MRVVMIGTGYVGLYQVCVLPIFGHDVTCIDTDAKK